MVGSSQFNLFQDNPGEIKSSGQSNLIPDQENLRPDLILTRISNFDVIWTDLKPASTSKEITWSVLTGERLPDFSGIRSGGEYIRSTKLSGFFQVQLFQVPAWLVRSLRWKFSNYVLTHRFRAVDHCFSCDSICFFYFLKLKLFPDKWQQEFIKKFVSITVTKKRTSLLAKQGAV